MFSIKNENLKNDNHQMQTTKRFTEDRDACKTSSGRHNKVDAMTTFKQRGRMCDILKTSVKRRLCSNVERNYSFLSCSL